GHGPVVVVGRAGLAADGRHLVLLVVVARLRGRRRTVIGLHAGPVALHVQGRDARGVRPVQVRRPLLVVRGRGDGVIAGFQRAAGEGQHLVELVVAFAGAVAVVQLAEGAAAGGQVGAVQPVAGAVVAVLEAVGGAARLGPVLVDDPAEAVQAG